MVTNHLQVNGIDVFSCFDLKSSDIAKTRGFKAMRVSLPLSQLDNILNASLWPQGVVVRPWKFKTASLGHESHSLANVATADTDTAVPVASSASDVS